jgi:hypothetical protein
MEFNGGGLFQLGGLPPPPFDDRIIAFSSVVHMLESCDRL